eukprot:TRINITY_DN9651_c0_g1_i1.p1 TRINITY_DN9651_c0_g1~~TRINITY_DN9651_c0_g1_i1.p1  ORF type:complete len:422 (+),score=130.50 TRINITY_DN9651_c0_g1_i1:45-1268(+)
MATCPMNDPVYLENLKNEIRAALVTPKSIALPIAMRLAWHHAGTFNKNDRTGGANGATMRFHPEFSDDANAGIVIILDLLEPIKRKHPELSYADLWALGGTAAVEFAGGPRIPFCFGRTDYPDNSLCPENGRLPDASQGAEHLRNVFYRMGLTDRDIVALSGGHTLGRCHRVRSGYDGPWTKHPLKFDNQYFTNLMNLEWKVKEWDGPLQYEDVETGELMMLPTDIALKNDPDFREFAELYANDETAFFNDFARSYAKLVSLGTDCLPDLPEEGTADMVSKISEKFRESAMHGSLDVVRNLASDAQVHEQEAGSGRTALHKAAFWGHVGTVDFLLNDCGLDPNVQDYNGDTALHDAARFGHEAVVKLIIASPNTDLSVKNREGQTPIETAEWYKKENIINLLNNAKL